MKCNNCANDIEFNTVGLCGYCSDLEITELRKRIKELENLGE